MRFSPLIIVCCVLCSATFVVAQNKEEDVELKSGEVIAAVVKDVHEEGIEIELGGIKMQVSWKLLRGERFLEERRELADDRDVESMRRFAGWLYEYALDDELKKANERIIELGGRAIESDRDAKEVVVEKPRNDNQTPGKSAIGSVSFAFSDDDAFATCVKDELRDFSIQMLESGADAELVISSFELEKTGGAEFFGNQIHSTYRATCRCELQDAQGASLVEGESFDSGEQKSYKSDDDAKRMAREMLANFVARWVSLKVQAQ